MKFGFGRVKEARSPEVEVPSGRTSAWEQPLLAPSAAIIASAKELCPSLSPVIAGKTSCSYSTTSTSVCRIRSIAPLPLPSELDHLLRGSGPRCSCRGRAAARVKFRPITTGVCPVDHLADLE